MNLLDLDPQSFEVYLAESNPPPEQRKFLIDEYQKRRSLFAPGFEAIQQAEQELADEGRRRLNILPASVPQGMSFYDALAAGKADFAVPGMFTGIGESLMTAVDMPVATLTGPTSFETMEESAQTLSELMIGLAAPAILRAASQGVDPTVVRMSGIGDNGGPPMEDKARLSSGLYSPSLDAVRQINQNAGTYQQLRAQLLKAGGKEEELRFAGLDDMFAPDEKVTRQQLEDALAQNVDMFAFQQSRASGRIGDQLDPNDSETMNQLTSEYVQRNLDSEREYYRNEVMPDMASEQLIPLREYVTPADTPELEMLTGISSADLDARRRQMMEQEVSRAGYASIDEYLEVFPDAHVEPSGGNLFDSLDEAIDRGVFGDLEEEAVRSLEEAAYSMDPRELAQAVGYQFSFNPENTQYSEYMTPGISDYFENRYSFSDPAKVLATTEPRGLPSVHDFGVENEMPNFVHTRGGFASVAGGTDNAYHVGEIQSDFGQGLRGSYSEPLPEETSADRALINFSSPYVADMTEKDWKQLQRMPDEERRISEIRGNVRERLQLDPDARPLELEDFQSAVSLAQSAARSRLDDSLSRMNKDYEAQLEQLEQVFESRPELYGDPEMQRRMRASLEDHITHRREVRDAVSFSNDPEKHYTLLASTYVPDWALDRIANRDWLSEEELNGLFAEGYRVPAAVELRQTLAQRNVNPEVYRGLVIEGLSSMGKTRTPQPFIGSTNRWVDFALKNELVQGALTGKRFFTVSNPEMVRRMTYGSEEGQGDFYGKIIPQRLKNIVKKLDKNIAVTTDMDEARALRMEGNPVLGPVRMSTDNGEEVVFGLDVTPDLRRKILGEEGRGLSSFRDGGLVSLLPTHN